MSIIGNGGYNSPELAAVAQNIANMFGPPSASELAGYSTARKNNQEVEQRERLAQIALDPNSDWTAIDRAGLGLGGWTPNQSFEGITRNNAVTMRGQDIDAATSRDNNLRDNQARLVLPLISPREPSHSAAGISEPIADIFELPTLPGFDGIPGPLTMTQWQAQEAERLSNGMNEEELKSFIFSSGDGSAREQQIARLTRQFLSTGRYADEGVARDMAIGVVDGRYETSRDPITGEFAVMDVTTSMPADMKPSALPTVATSAGYVPTGDTVIDAIYGNDAPSLPATGPTVEAGEARQPYPAAPRSFGVEGWASGGLNRVADGLGMTAPYPDIQQSQADFAVLRENLLNTMQDAYGRQPPSWLLERIDRLTPDTGNPFEGVGQARAELESLSRQFMIDLQSAQSALETPLAPQQRMEKQNQVRGLEKALGELDIVLGAVGGPPPTPRPAPAMSAPDADGWVTAPNGVRIREVQ